MYTVGEVIYIFKESNNSIFPCVVSEEVCKKTLQGETKSYTVLLPDVDGTTVELSKMDVKPFSSLKEFEKYYIDSYTKKMHQMTNNCRDIENEKFKKFLKQEKSIENFSLKSKEEDKKIVIEDGNTKLNIDMSKLKEVGL